MALTSVRSISRGDAVPAAASGRTSPGFVQGFDGLRAVAALLVIVVHTGIMSGFTVRQPGVGQYFARGEIGVSVFFLISGFLLYRPFVAARFAGQRGPATARYLRRRALRIFPLYWAALAVTYAVGVSPVQGVSGVLGHAFFLQVYSPHWRLAGVSQAWTLCIEATFYLALPLWAAGLRVGHRRESPSAQAVLRRELTALAGLYLVSFLFRWWADSQHTGVTSTARYWLPSWSDHFALGMALAAIGAYVAETGEVPRLLRWTSRTGADLTCWVVAGVLFWTASTQAGLSVNPANTPRADIDLLGHLLYGTFAVFVLLPAVLGPPRRGPVRRLLSSRVLSLIGLISYGVYLWHEVVMFELQKYVSSWQVLASPYPQFAASVLGIALAVSALTYLLVERPGIALGHRRLLRQREHQGRT